MGGRDRLRFRFRFRVRVRCGGLMREEIGHDGRKVIHVGAPERLPPSVMRMRPQRA